mgnify:CR=1 FL=1
MIKSKKLSNIKNLKHGFFNSKGGISKNIYKSLNCGPGSRDKPGNVRKNLELVRKKSIIQLGIFFYLIKFTAINSFILTKNIILNQSQKQMR